MKFATEAYVRRPTMAMIGDVAGGEFVLKPSTVSRLMSNAFGQGAAAQSDTPQQGSNYNVTVVGNDPAGEEKWLRDWHRRNGVKITVEEIQDGRYVTELRQKLVPELVR